MALYQVHYEGKGTDVDRRAVTIRLRVYRDGQPVGRFKVRVSQRDIGGLPPGIDEGDTWFLAAMAWVGGQELEDRVRQGRWPSSDWSVVPNIALSIGRVLERLADPAGLPDLGASPGVGYQFTR